MSLELVKQNSSELKPPEVRIAKWEGLLKKMFLFETASYNEVISLDPSSLMPPEIPPNPTPEQIQTIISSIPKIEDAIAKLTKRANEVQKERMAFTKPINEFISDRMMLPENTLKLFSQNLSKAIIPLKQLEQSEKNKKIARERELTSWRQTVQSNFNSNVASAELYIQQKVTEFYNTALDQVDASSLDKFINNSMWLVTEQNFQPLSTFNKDPDKKKISEDIYEAWSPKTFVDRFQSELRKAFLNFDQDKLNKEDAARRRAEEEEQAKADVDFEKTMADSLAKADASISKPSSNLSVLGQKTKELKTVYLIDMPHNDNSMTKIIRAFFANFVSCMANYRGEDCFNISISKMGELLCSIKNNDDKFQPDEIIFKSENKI